MKKNIILLAITIMLLTNIGCNQNNEKALKTNSEETVTSVYQTQPVVLEKPPFQYYKSEKTKDQKTNSIRLELISATPSTIVDTEAWFKTNNLSINQYEASNLAMSENKNAPRGIPETFRGEMLVAGIFYPNTEFLIYGNVFGEGHYLISTYPTNYNVRYSLDFINYSYSPEYIEEDRELIYQGITWVEEQNGVLYISNSHPTYAHSSKGMNAYITAINLADYSLLWRTRPLVSNTRNFVIINDFIITGYGYTKEKDYLYVVNKHTGELLNTITLKSGPEYLIYKDGKLFVRTYDTDYVFKVLIN